MLHTLTYTHTHTHTHAHTHRVLCWTLQLAWYLAHPVSLWLQTYTESQVCVCVCVCIHVYMHESVTVAANIYRVTGMCVRVCVYILCVSFIASMCSC
jgi:hypothetical protein